MKRECFNHVWSTPNPRTCMLCGYKRRDAGQVRDDIGVIHQRQSIGNFETVCWLDVFADRWTCPRKAVVTCLFCMAKTIRTEND